MPITPSEFVENLNDPNKVFLSYAAKISSVKFTLLLEHFADKADDVFYYCEPERNISFLSFDKLTKQSFQSGEFNKLSSEITALKSKLVTNHKDYENFNLPVFILSAKFPIKSRSEEWKDFGDIDFIVPKIILYQNSNDCFLVANLFSESFSNQGYFSDFLEHEAELIYKLEAKLATKNFDRTTIEKIDSDANDAAWIENISGVISNFKNNKIEKIVISRRIENEIKSGLSWQKTIEQLNNKYPSCANFLYKSTNSIFFGSTPEVLINFSQNNFSTESLAGSIKRGETVEKDKILEQELLKSEKNQKEHQAVVDHIKNAINNFVSEINVVESPVIKKLPNIQHLQTNIDGTLKENTDMFSVISNIFPTPAVCGIPKELSLEMIEQTEKFDRGLFSGIIGWFNADDYGEFFVTIRSALVRENKLYAYAGCGLLEESDPREEFEETQLKLKPILSLFNDANKS
jgi:menaquinone-specific isochorismate synthase